MPLSHNPYLIVSDFENRLAEWCGSKYCVCVESGTAAIFLSLQYRKKQKGELGKVTIPKHTYNSVACSIIHSGGKIGFWNGLNWEGYYGIYPLDIFDAALRFKKNMYDNVMIKNNGLMCLSFHIKKHLPIGRGGAILLDDAEAYEWLKLARFDGREQIPIREQKEFKVLGWNMYMSVEQAARGIELFEVLRRKHPDGLPDLSTEDQGYPDLSKFPIYQQ